MFSKKQMNQLVAAFAAASIKQGAATKQPKSKRRRRRRPARNPSTTVPAAVVAKVPRKTAGAISNDGSAVISRTELFKSLKGKKGVAEILEIHPKKLTWLCKIAPGYSSVVWLSAKFYWKPAVGSTTNGSLVMGVDWGYDTTKDTNTRANAQALAPMMETPVWQPGGVLSLPAGKLMSRRIYDLNATQGMDNSPGQICMVIDADGSDSEKFYGDVWITYKVKLLNPKST